MKKALFSIFAAFLIGASATACATSNGDWPRDEEQERDGGHQPRRH
ncbi:hypothetical protein PUV54_02085 [Hyphococcus flavus]|uniref:Lipoprotein n=1 Tax=Hyphococcus flavus TaxID=1866326 RepID=A0AAF0CGA6_9PROT|nr:hypothetical protein [Hyphococcus flavus]WDI31978.1 hypothetical protein PUV54_02085 [Hyphococcus flavus]